MTTAMFRLACAAGWLPLLAAASPLPELAGARAYRPSCVAEGARAAAIAPAFCRAVADALDARGAPGVRVTAPGDAGLVAAGTVAIGFTLSDWPGSDGPRPDGPGPGGVLVAARLSRSDRPSGALYPPAATALPADADAVAIAAAARRMLRRLGL